MYLRKNAKFTVKHNIYFIQRYRVQVLLSLINPSSGLVQDKQQE